MANSISVAGLTKYVDQLNVPIIREAIFSNKTFDVISKQTGIKHSDALNIMTDTATIVAGGCAAFSPAGTVTLSQKNITVCPLKIEQAICWDILEGYWLGQIDLKEGSYTEELPNFFYNAFVDSKVDYLGLEMEKIFWQGDTGGSGNLAVCDGVLKYVATGSSIVTVDATGSGTTGNLTSVTAISTIERMLDARPEGVKEKDNQSLWMSPTNFDVLYRALFKANNFYFDGSKFNDYAFVYPGTNVTVRGTAGLSGTPEMLLTPNDNLYLGVDSINDPSAMDIWYSRENNAVQVRIKWKQGFAIPYNQYVVYYSAIV